MSILKTFNSKTTFNISPEIFHSDVNDETVILNLKSDTYFGLDEVGTGVWELLKQSKSVLEIRNALLEEYEVEESQCDRDLQELLQALVDAELIEVKSE